MVTRWTNSSDKWSDALSQTQPQKIQPHARPPLQVATAAPAKTMEPRKEINPLKTFQEAVGQTLRQLRRKHKLTLDQIAHAGRELGATWSASSVSNIEKGVARPTLPSLFFLIASINSLTGMRMSLLDLIGDEPSVLLNNNNDEDSAVTRQWLEDILGTAPVVMEHPIEPLVKRVEKKTYRASLAERRVMDKLDIAIDQLYRMSTAMWGQSFEDERDDRAVSDTPQARERITRELIDEMQLALRQQS